MDDFDLTASLQALMGSNASDVSSSLERRNQRLRHDNEFRAKSARQRFNVDYLGNGRHFPEDPVLFKYMFTEEPTFNFGVIAREGISNLYIGNATAYVTSFLMTDDGQKCLGAKMGYYVDVRDINDSPVNASVFLTFSLTFEGITVPIPLA